MPDFGTTDKLKKKKTDLFSIMMIKGMKGFSLTYIYFSVKISVRMS